MSNLFRELYSSYYNAVAAILRRACENGSISSKEINDLTMKYAFRESVMEIPVALSDGTWNLLDNGESKLINMPTMPLTTLQLRWLKSLLSDPRIGLFLEDDLLLNSLSNVEPLWDKEDVKIYDNFADGDYYEDANYRSNWRTILEAIREGRALNVHFISNKNKEHHMYVMPTRLEYSEKNDKFRLLGVTSRGNVVINVSNIVRTELLPEGFEITSDNTYVRQMREVVISLKPDDGYNTLERIMLNFAHYEKEAVMENGNCLLTIKYDSSDETEILIGILSFGPRVKVEAPSSFVALLKERIARQIDVADFFP
ncbi:MAG: WYL domain-containing protein [Saccharofermentans sp.]|nr:WYL domain-containing protein [Saccharofermentans sp.]